MAEEILQSNPDHLDARLILAQARYALSDVDGARKAAEEATKRHPSHPGSHVLLGRIAFDEYRLLKDRFDVEQPTEPERGQMVTAIDAARKRAQAAFAAAAKLDPNRTFSHVMLGDIAARDRDIDAALRHWGDALSVDPENSALKTRMIEINRLRAEGQTTLPTSLALELATNPFLRTEDAGLRASLGMDAGASADVFAELRDRKNKS
jgi:tetratricopeptide (TPR) repeat protein